MDQTSIPLLLKIKQRAGLSRSTIYVRIKSGKLSKLISLCGRAVGWLMSNVDAFIESCINSSRVEKELLR